MSRVRELFEDYQTSVEVRSGGTKTGVMKFGANHLHTPTLR
jgi:hypothetical protein